MENISYLMIVYIYMNLKQILYIYWEKIMERLKQ